MKAIVQKENKVLRKKATVVAPDLIKSEKIKKIIENMKEALLKEADGIALAAPQIGESYRIFIISHRIFQEDGIEGNSLKIEDDKVFINPTIVRKSKEKEVIEEGCLSIRGKYGFVERFKKVRVRAYNEKGEVFELGGSDLMAQIFQHEIDHLDGLLFTDKAEEVNDILPDDNLNT